MNLVFHYMNLIFVANIDAVNATLTVTSLHNADAQTATCKIDIQIPVSGVYVTTDPCGESIFHFTSLGT